MKKTELIVAALIVLVALGVAFYGRTSSTPENADSRLRAALQARVVPVVVATAGRGGAAGEFLRSVRQALTGVDSARLIHVDTLNPVERESAARFPREALPLVMVVGLDGVPGYTKTALVEPDAIKAAIAEGLTKPPVKIEEHVHDDSCGHSH